MGVMIMNMDLKVRRRAAVLPRALSIFIDHHTLNSSYTFYYPPRKYA